MKHSVCKKLDFISSIYKFYIFKFPNVSLIMTAEDRNM